MDRRTLLFGTIGLVTAGLPALGKVRSPTIVADGGGTMGTSNARRLISLAPQRRVLLSPYSGSPVEVAAEEGSYLRSWGFSRVEVLDLSDAAKALAQIDSIGMIWFAGGLQKSQVLALSGVPGVVEALNRAYLSGTVMAGGSAGAAVMTKLMISGGKDGEVYTRAGLGFWPEAVIDQHVRARRREYRLQKVIAQNPSLVGIGLDEGCMIVFSNGRFSVSGKSFAIVTRWVDGALNEERLRPGQTYDMIALSRV